MAYIKKYFFFLSVIIIFSCNNKETPTINKLVDDYFDAKMKYHTVWATFNGIHDYNDTITMTFTDEFNKEYEAFNKEYLNKATQIDIKTLSKTEQETYKIFLYDIKRIIESMKFKTNRIPMTQFRGMHLTFAQLGSGKGAQPFNTVKDYDNFHKRVEDFQDYINVAIEYFKKGVNEKYVLPDVLVTKMIMQIKNLINVPLEKSVFYGPVKNMPDSFSKEDKKRLKERVIQDIAEIIEPTYSRLAIFLEKEYFPHARKTDGIYDVPKGKEFYDYTIFYWTTYRTPAEEIYQIGLKEVARIRAEMEKVKEEVGFKGSLEQFMASLKTNKKLMPFRNADEIIAFYQNTYKRMKPYVEKYFTVTPQTPFEIRRVESYREKTTSAHYYQGDLKSGRPGIFYFPAPYPKKYNLTSGMESLFLHEAIPGHHFQISLQQENVTLPKYRKYNRFGAYSEGWALYCESLGKELGLYKDPYQYFGALGHEIHRAIRFVVDVGLHTGKMTREEAIAYMMDNEPIEELRATSEIERYMSMPGQALAYLTGSMLIKNMRAKYEEKLGDKFNLALFHDEILDASAMPLELLEERMNTWAESFLDFTTE